MLIAGIDYSSHALDIVTIHIEGDPQPTWTHIPLKRDGHRLPAFSAARHIRQALGQAALLGSFWDNIAAAYIEYPFSRGNSAAALQRLQGAILAQIPPHVVAEELRPGEWRMLVGLPGNATKEKVAEFARRHGMSALEPDGRITLSQDSLDAYCIALAGRALCHRAAQGDAA